MSRSVSDAELVVTDPAGNSVVTVPGGDLESVSIDEVVQDVKDTGEIVVANHDQAYTGGQRITTGDKLVFRVQLAGQNSLSDRWTAIARSPEDVLQGGQLQTTTVPAEDFVFAVLNWRLGYEAFDDAPIAGNSDAILDSLLADEAPEIGTGRIGDFTSTTSDLNVNGRKLLDVVRDDLAPLADALVYNDGEDLVFEALADVSAKHALTPADFRGDVRLQRDDDHLVNLVRVDGGTGHATDDEQPTQSAYTTVTNSSRITHQLQVRKSEVDRVAIHTRVDASSSDGIVVRLQADRGGSPVDVADQQSDVARRTLAKEFLSSDGLTTFLLPDHELAPNSDPWLIVEADGPDGHDIGVDGSGVPRYDARYPYPLLARLPRTSSQDEFRRRDHRIKDDSLETEDAVRDKARAFGRHNDEPRRTLEGEARTLRAHQLAPGEAVDMQEWTSRLSDVSGRWIVTERGSDFDGQRNELTTTLTLVDAEAL